MSGWPYSFIFSPFKNPIEIIVKVLKVLITKSKRTGVDQQQRREKFKQISGWQKVAEGLQGRVNDILAYVGCWGSLGFRYINFDGYDSQE